MNLLKKIDEYLIESAESVAIEKFVAQGNDRDEVESVLNSFKKNKIKIKKGERSNDIAFWTKQSFKDFSIFVKELEKAKTVREERREVKKEDIIVIKENSEIKFFIPRTETVSCEYGKGTKWCTAGKVNNTFEEYLHKIGHTLYYAILKKGMDPKLMRNPEFVKKFNPNLGSPEKGLDMYMSFKPEEYNKIAILVRRVDMAEYRKEEERMRKEYEKAKRAGKDVKKKKPARLVQPFDIVDNFLTDKWLHMFCDRYGINYSDDLILRTVEKNGKYDYE